MGFELSAREVARTTVVAGSGRFTLTDGRTKLRDLIHVSASNGKKKFILNLAQVEFIDSYGVGELVRCYSVVRQAGGDLKLAAVSPRVLEVLEISKLTRLFEVYPTEADALRALG